ncbi:uncharacterized protein H6S33_001917 [Morchella sextelata]|uniref:uncharacterized protein n=1 Tax=Morchella sextelata TaxID=1174677 RepID=UPI001D043EA8|nr:uncharacterized protein H6S33_001917 [Morchella sextelata]KAH0607865.1 hypothetical protein H6S33_001917 [Morchella sextelata]
MAGSGGLGQLWIGWWKGDGDGVVVAQVLYRVGRWSRERSSASSHITQGAAPSSWWAFRTPSAYRIWHHQSTPLTCGFAPGAPNLPAPPGDMAHVRKALTNALLAWAAMRLSPAPEMLGWSDPDHSIYGTFTSF